MFIIFFRYGDMFLLGDIAFPATRNLVRPLSILEKQRLPPEQRDRFELMNTIVSRTRVAAEWGLSSLKLTFRILKAPLPTNPQQRLLILKSVCFLHNIRTRILHLGQIGSVFSC